MQYFLSCLKSPVAVGELDVISLPARVFLGAGLTKTASGRNEGGPLARLYRCVSFTLDIILLRLSQKAVVPPAEECKYRQHDGESANIQRRLLCKERPLNKGIGGPRKGDLIRGALMEAATRLLPERY